MKASDTRPGGRWCMQEREVVEQQAPLMEADLIGTPTPATAPLMDYLRPTSILSLRRFAVEHGWA